MGNVVKASSIAKFLGAPLVGKDIKICSASSLANISSSSVTFSKKSTSSLNSDIPFLLLAPLISTYESSTVSVIKVSSPRLAFAKVVNEFLVKKIYGEVHRSVIIGENCKIDSSVSIGGNCIIGDNVNIAANTIINHNVVIASNSSIGEGCYIKSGSVIGEDGFGFDFEENGTPIRIPHLGKVIIGNNVEIGAKNTIARGTLDDTIIESNVKIDDQVHIAHNCHIGKNTLITACVEISGSVIIGENCWIAPNATIIQKVTIGDNAVIGIGSLILKDIKPNKKIMGLEGLELKKLVKLKRSINYGE